MDPKTHECSFPEVVSSGQRLLGPCLTCGLTAAAALMRLRGDTIRRVVVDFLNQASKYSTAGLGAQNTEDLARWTGHVKARRMLELALEDAGIDPTMAPDLHDATPSKPSPRHAKLVRDLHVLEVVELAGVRLSSCKADGYVTDDLAANPCPTLQALNETDPPPLVDRERLAGEIYNAIVQALCNAGVPDWSMIGEARKAAEGIAEDFPVLDLDSKAAQRLVLAAITTPARFVSRDGDAVPGHQARAVLAALKGGRP